MQIIPVRDDIFEAVLALNEDAVPHVNLIGTEELLWFTDQAAFIKAAMIEGRLAGFLIGLRPGLDYASPNYQWFCKNYDDFAYIDRVVVDPKARRKGVAQYLYKAFEESQADAPVLTCEVNLRPANEGSMLFHRRMGFRIVDSQLIDEGAKEVALMEKEL